jgi:hypothetical protein
MRLVVYIHAFLSRPDDVTLTGDHVNEMSEVINDTVPERAISGMNRMDGRDDEVSTLNTMMSLRDETYTVLATDGLSLLSADHHGGSSAGSRRPVP